MAKYNIMGVSINVRTEYAIEVQKILTDNGCTIKARLGLHETSETSCSNEGLLILQLLGSEEEIQKLKDALNAIDGVTAEYMTI